MNLLAQESSPYLLQHKDNPVHWLPWSPFSFAKAKAENKPVLLSIGYAACHWCHVMAHESFENAETASLMNQYFINIKVDREELPDVDMVYQNALALMGRQGGWPLTMFLTPEGAPFWGGTYFPPLARHGLPGFREVLRGVNTSWQGEQGDITHNVQSLTAALQKLQAPAAGHIVTREMLEQINLYFLQAVDTINGGIGHAPKFPSLPAMNLLWDAYVRTGSDAYKSAVLHSLTQMCQGGIYDHLGGGFSRYTVDAEWLVPHFEKMLYDNAQFISLLAEVYKETQNPLFGQRIRETVKFLARDMLVTEDNAGAFASSFDADSMTVDGHKHEGAYYTWRAAEIDTALGDDALAFKQTYDVTVPGNWEGVNILNRLKHPALLAPAEEAKLAMLCKKLAATRQARPLPPRDDKVLADWNGLAILALLRAHIALKDDAGDCLKMAGSAFGFVTRHMMNAEGKLSHVFCNGKKTRDATLDDYAQMAAAALLFFETTHNGAYLAKAERWVAILNADYWDAEHGGYYLALPQQELPLRPKTADDHATPSGNGTMVGVLTRLWLLTGRDEYRAKAAATAEAFSGGLMQRFFPLTTLVTNSDFLAHPVTVVIIGRLGRDALRDVLKTISVPHLVVLEIDGAQHLPESHPAHGKLPVNGQATAYLCHGPTCQPPVTEPANLRDLLLAERGSNRRPAANDL